MPVPDPIPPQRPLKKRFLAWMRLAAAISLISAAYALILALAGESVEPVRKAILVAIVIGAAALSGVTALAFVTLRRAKPTGKPKP